MSSRFGLPTASNLEVISIERNNATIQAFLDEFIPEILWEFRDGKLNDPELGDNVNILQKCLKDHNAEGIFWWGSEKLSLEGYGDGHDGIIEVNEILIKSVQFLQDGHVIFCLYLHQQLGDLEQQEEKKVMEALKKCVKSQLGYIGGPGSPRVASFGEFMVQMKQHLELGHYLLRRGTFEGKEMTAWQFIGLANTLYKDLCGESQRRVIAHTTDRIIVMCGELWQFHFLFREETETGEAQHKYFSSSFDLEREGE